MDTKSKAKKTKILSALSVLIIFIGYMFLSLALLNGKSVLSYLNSGDTVNYSSHNKQSEVMDLLFSYCSFYNDIKEIGKTDGVFITEHTKEELSYLEKNLDELAKQGYRYVIKDSGENMKDILKDKFADSTSLSYIYSKNYHYETTYGYNFQPYIAVDAAKYAAGDNTGSENMIEYATENYYIYVWLTDEAENNIRAWEIYYKSEGEKYFTAFCGGVFLIIGGFVLSGITSHIRTKNENKLREILFHEKIYNDILVLIYFISSYFLIYFSIKFFNTHGAYSVGFYWFTEIMTGAYFSLFSYKVFSNLIKRAKRNELLAHTSFASFYRYLKNGIIKITKALKSTVKGYIIFFIISFIFSLFLGIIIFVILINITRSVYFASLITLIYFLAVSFTVFKSASDLALELEEIKEATAKMRDGDFESKLPSYMNPLFGNLPENLNSISEGMDKAVKKAVSSEKMKTELISNVSHDLKTPLTSILSYVEFLNEDKNLSDESRDYVNIIKQKSLRLKNMIADIFDLSKASSQTELSVNETLGFKQLINQTLTEMSDKIESSASPLKVSLPENELYVKGDGKKLFRVLQNLIDNAIKYSLKGTRIYIKLSEAKGEAVFEIKNISSYEMNFTESEILERFKRGDESRSSEGSGLGLSIADSFVKNMNGSFNIKIDDDIFKAEIIFKTVQIKEKENV